MQSLGSLSRPVLNRDNHATEQEDSRAQRSIPAQASQHVMASNALDPQSQPNAKISYLLQTTEITGAHMRRYIKRFSDDSNLLTQAQALKYSRLDLEIYQAGKHVLSSPLLRSSSLSPELNKTITKVSIFSDEPSNLCTDSDIPDLQNLTELYLQKPSHNGLYKIHLLKNLTTLEIDNTHLNESLKKIGQLFQPEPCICDLTLNFLETCPKLTKLKLINVNTVTDDAILKLQQKMPQLNVEKTLQPSSSDVEAVFRITHCILKDGQFLQKRMITKTYEKECLYKDVGLDTVVLRRAVKLNAAGIVRIIKEEFVEKIIDAKEVQTYVLKTDEPIWHGQEIADFLQSFVNLKNLTLYNITKKALHHFKGLTQIQTVTINNASLKKAIAECSQFYDGKLEDLQPINDTSIFELLQMKNLKEIFLEGCDEVSDHVIDYANTVRHDVLSVKRGRKANENKGELPKSDASLGEKSGEKQKPLPVKDKSKDSSQNESEIAG